MYVDNTRTRLVCALMGAFVLLIGCAERQGSSSVGDLPDASSQSARIVQNSEYPAVVKVVSPDGRGLCTGTFVSPRAVLTAAHCVLEPGQYYVFSSFGRFATTEIYLGGPGVVDDPNDIAILVLDRDRADPALGQVLPIGTDVRSGETVRLVGFGCNSLTARTGAGVKRTGTNQIYDVSDYIEFITPLTNSGTRGILGPINRAGSCFGDSGGPAIFNGTVIGVAHAGGQSSSFTLSEYADLSRSDNLGFISGVNSARGLGILGI